MIDIHHHCLPGVDDGPRSMSEAEDLCRMAAAEGIDTIVATPHVLRGRWKNTSRAQLEELLRQLAERLDGAPRLLLGSEYWFGHDMDEVLRAGSPIIPLAGARSVLVEFPSHAVPPLAGQPLHRALLDGWIPIIAHPERNEVFRAKPDILIALLRMGVRSQVTAGSLLGDFGREAQRAGMSWIRAGLVHAVATDAHNSGKRPPHFRKAWERVADSCGEPIARALFLENPRAIVEGRPLPYDPEIPDRLPATGLVGRLRRLVHSG